MFRHPTTNVRLTKALFLEESYTDKTFVLYTLKDKDHNEYPSLYRKYLLMDDLTEVTFANTYFDGWEHWCMVCECTWFKPFITRWRQELELLTRSKALSAIQAIAGQADHKSSYEANKYLLSGNWKSKEEKGKVGRPTKDAIRQQAELLFLQKNETEEDYKRILS